MKPFLLIANGNQDLTRAVQRTLARHDYHVETAAGGLECVAKLRQARPNFLVLDLDLPWGGGEGVLEWLAEDQRGARPGAVLLTGTPPTEEVMHLLIPPVVHYLQKPFSLRVLLRAIAACEKAQGLPGGRRHLRNATLGAPASALNGAAALVRPLPAFLETSNAGAWGAIIEDMTPSLLRLTVCYPFPRGTCLAVELEAPGSASRALAVRVLTSADQGERMWRLQCEYLPAVMESPLGFVPLQTQSVG